MVRNPQQRTSYVVIAVLALTLALGGGAAAVAAPLTEKAVKKIAKTQVKKLAPTLSVAKAKDADSLGGVPASAYLQKSGVRVDGTATSSDITVLSGPVAVLTKTFTAPTDGYVLITASLSAYKQGPPGSTSWLQYWLSVDGTALTTDASYHEIVTTDAAFADSGAVTSVVQVSAGAHTVALQAKELGAGTQVRGRDLSLVFTPTGSAPVLPY